MFIQTNDVKQQAYTAKKKCLARTSPPDHTVVEWCPHCESEIEMQWDINKRGLSAFCPVCGQRLMLCDECRHLNGTLPCDYDRRSDTCHMAKAAKRAKLVTEGA